MDPVLLSVVVPTFDTAAMTLRCCASVLAGLPEDCELIVSDDGSRDGTAERLARELPAVRVVRHAANRGFAAAANRGVAAARGRLVMLLNSDTVVRADALMAIVDAFGGDARLGVAGAQLVGAGGAPQWSAGAPPTILWLTAMAGGFAPLARPFRRRREETREVGWVTGAAMAFRREVWDAAGPLREDFGFYAQDLDFCVRAGARGWRVKLLAEARVEHVRGGTIAGDAPLPYVPELLWTDLVTWGRDAHGEPWARAARRAMRAAAGVRIVLRRAAERFLPADARRRSAAVTGQFARGYDALGRMLA